MADNFQQRDGYIAVKTLHSLQADPFLKKMLT